MSRQLPARPNLEHLRTQAKALLTKLREGDANAARAFSKYLPEAAKMSPPQVRERGFRLADAQAAIARKSGFGAWPGLARHVERLRSLEGKWAFRSLETDGMSMPASMLSRSFLLMDGDRFRMESPEATYEGVFLIDVEQTPNTIDIDFVEGPEAGERCEGIFELDGDRLRICLGLVGSTRPSAFATKKGSGHALEELERVESARPAGVDGGTPQPAAAAPAAVNAPAGFDATVTATIERLQGEWLPVELITSGAPLEQAYLPYGSRVHEGVETKVIFGGQAMLHVTMRCNESTTPLEIDYLNLAGKNKGTVSLGIFRWDGDDAVFCIASPGKPRPDDFTSAPRSGRILSRWKRHT